MNEEQAIANFESLRQGCFEEHFSPGMLTGEQLTVAGLAAVSAQLAQISRQLAGGQPPLMGAAPSFGSTLQTVIALDIPLDPRHLNQYLISNLKLHGYFFGQINQTAIAVPAASGGLNGTASIDITLPEGYVMTVSAPVVPTSSDVGANLTSTMTVDGKNAIGAYGAILGPAQQIQATQFFVAVDSGVNLGFSNPSATPVTVYLYLEQLFIQRLFYDTFYAPLLDLTYNTIKAKIGNGGGV